MSGYRPALLVLVNLLAPVRVTFGQVPDWAVAQEEAVEYLSAYLAIDSSNPPGRTMETTAFLRDVLEREGIEVTIYDAGDGRYNLLARLRGDGSRGNPLLLLHHMDVVPAEPEKWSHPPFRGSVADGYVWGRGALDMKGMGIIELMAVLLTKRQDVPLGRDVLYLAVADEETGGNRGAAWMTSRHWDVLDPEIVWDEGGFGSRGLLTRDDLTIFSISVAEKKVFWLRLIAEGTAGHGSQPHHDNPVDALTMALGRLAGHEFPPASSPVIIELKDRLGGLAENKFTNAVQRNTCSLTTLRAGVGEPPKVNVIPSRAEATLDCRLLPDVDPAAFLQELKGIMGSELFTSGRLRFEPIYEPPRESVASPYRTGAFRAVESVIGRLAPGSVVVPLMIPWGTDSRFFRERGAKAYGLIPIVVTAEEIARVHGVDERISVEALGFGVRAMTRVVQALAGR